MILSIGMIVKNEEKYLDMCLSAIKPILDNVDSELIIADTGSTDRTVEIAKKYTDNVFYFEWINDFAAARNSTLERAKGEWYLYIDADEIFQSCDSIIKFFNSGEYKNYEAADYTMRNFSDEKMESYSPFSAKRFLKIRPDMRFCGRIHEFIPIYEDRKKLKHLDDIANHYGYMYEDKELKKKKYERNKKMLLEVLENTEHPRVLLYVQIIETLLLGENEDVIPYFDKGIEAGLNGNDPDIYILYTRIMQYYFIRNDFDKVLEVCDEYFKLPELLPKPIASDGDMCIVGALCETKLSNYAKTIDYAVKAFDIYRRIKNGSLHSADMKMPRVIVVDYNFGLVLYAFLYSCVQEKRYALAADYFNVVPVREYYNRTDSENTHTVMQTDFNVMRGAKNYRRIEALRSQLSRSLLAELEVFVHREILLSEDKEKLFSAIKKAYKSDGAMLLLAEAAQAHFNGKNSSEFIEKIPADRLKYFYELLYFAVKEQQDITPIISLPGYNFKFAVNFLFTCSGDFAQHILDYPLENISDNGIPGLLNLYETIMRIAAKNEDYIYEIFPLWGAAGLRLCVARNLSADDLSGQLFGAVMAAEAANEMEQGNYKDCLNALIALVRNYPAAKPFVLAIRNKLQKEVKPVNEMDSLAAQFKDNIRTLISNGELEQAKQLLGEYKEIMPNDSEAGELEKAICAM